MRRCALGASWPAVVVVGRAVCEAEAGEVKRDPAQPALGKLGKDLAIQERGSPHAVHADHGSAVSLIADKASDAGAYVCARLADPNLTPQAVADALHISVRQLHRLFADQEATFSRFLREERLQRCHRDLSNPGLINVSIADLARRWGYKSPAHFTRAFTERYGIGPRETRSRATLIGRG